jgi:hypothetical protein
MVKSRCLDVQPIVSAATRSTTNYRRIARDIGSEEKWRAQGMNAVQAFLLGMMVAWTPSLILLGWMLWRVAISQGKRGNSQDKRGNVTPYGPQLPLDRGRAAARHRRRPEQAVSR